MAILFEQNEFHLYNEWFSYLMRVLPDGSLGQVYCGARLRSSSAYPLLGPVLTPDRDTLPFEYPVTGSGDYRLPACAVRFADGSSVVDPVYKTHRIYNGKAAVEGLPALYVDQESDAATLEIDMVDAVSGLTITLFYTIFEHYPAIIRRSRLCNQGTTPVVLHKALSMSLDLPDSEWIMGTFTGAWTQEFHLVERRFEPGIQAVSSTKGGPGHQQNPFLLLRRPQTGDSTGEAMGLSLIYSGNFLASAETGYRTSARVQMGINPDQFSWTLEPGADFNTPEALLVYSDAGLDSLSHTFHSVFRNHLMRGVWKDRDRPVLLNNWEGTYFNFNEAKLLEMAAAAKDMGIELFVLDDGWFGQRDSDNSSLGDWFPDHRKLPDGIAGLAHKITGMGLSFGLWIEPEMISRVSKLFDAHPDWAVGVPGRPRTEQRQQYVLDMSRPEIVTYLFSILSELLSSAPISYIKWDMNRALTEPYSLDLQPERQGEFFHRYCLGVYDLYGRLTKAFPHILFESCAGGGGRFDPGIMAFAPQGWLSDDTDGFERIRIQTGASLCYPPNSWGSHVSAVPNHQTGRMTSLPFRAIAAFFGNLGFELDPTKLQPEDKKQISIYLDFYKKHRRVFQQGTFTRLRNPDRHDYAAWQVSDASETLVGFFKLLAQPNSGPVYMRLKDLDQAARYNVSVWEPGGYEPNDKAVNCGNRGGDELVRSGLVLDSSYRTKQGDFFAEVFVIERVQEG
ncbi:alpha-galactosidase [Spirochaetia bacterium]|nr:alpha-galactosidase [Spirochaetia bacterium]GHU32809.1 alpha-galactosidase [Spirochaetia bacterium]